MIRLPSPIRHEWWACKPWQGGEWFAKYVLTILGIPITIFGHRVHGPFESAHEACNECERQIFLEGRYAHSKCSRPQKGD